MSAKYTYVYLCIVINPIIKLYEYFYKKKVCLLFFNVFCYYFYVYAWSTRYESLPPRVVRFRKILGRRVIVRTYESTIFFKRQITFIKVFPFVAM